MALFVSMFLLGVQAPLWVWFISFGLNFSSMTTYHKWLNPLVGGRKDTVYWYGWAMHGFACAFAVILFVIFGNFGIVAFLLRLLILTVTTCLWSVIVGNAVVEESGRGFLYNITLLTLVI